ncbi:MAG: L,D-transpeptidase [Methylacidiphilales bacterium]|nr:L,D-transpeptidase [Candidatus Methylacidiphilales bacterium]
MQRIIPALLTLVFFCSGLSATPEQHHKKFIRVDLSCQKAYVIQDGDVIWETDLSSGRDSNPTPTGNYAVTDKHEYWVSTIYNIPMPYFMRLSSGEMGMHAGWLPGFPASHGCMRMPLDKAKELFESTEVGTPVIIEGKAPPMEEVLQANQSRKASAHLAKNNSKLFRGAGSSFNRATMFPVIYFDPMKYVPPKPQQNPPN